MYMDKSGTKSFGRSANANIGKTKMQIKWKMKKKKFECNKKARNVMEYVKNDKKINTDKGKVKFYYFETLSKNRYWNIPDKQKKGKVREIYKLMASTI